MKRFIDTAPLIFDENARIEEAIEALAKSHKHHVLATDKSGQLSGIASLCDFMSAVSEGGEGKTLGEICSSPVRAICFDRLIHDLMREAKEYQFSAYPVFRKPDLFDIPNLVGLLDLKDFAKYIVASKGRKKISALLS